jgi:hypothetical protein
MRKLKRLSTTQQLQAKITDLECLISKVSSENAVLKAENRLFKEFNDIFFKQGVTSLTKALRVVTDTMATKLPSQFNGRL